MKEYLEAGKITNTHGVRGEVRIEPWADSAEFLRTFRTLYVDGAPRRVASSSVHKRMLLVRFEGFDDVNAAMALKNKVVSIARADAKLPEGRYFVQDLIGLRVQSDAGEELGTVAELLDLPAGRVWVVQGRREILIPDVPDFIREIDLDAGAVTVHLIEGM